jgi:hypothetical protein
MRRTPLGFGVIVATLAFACGQVSGPAADTDGGSAAIAMDGGDDAGGATRPNADGGPNGDSGPDLLADGGIVGPAVIGQLEGSKSFYADYDARYLTTDDAFVYAGVYEGTGGFGTVRRFPKSGGGGTGEILVKASDALYEGSSLAVHGTQLFFMQTSATDPNGAVVGAAMMDLKSRAVTSIPSPGTMYFGYRSIALDSAGRAYWQGGTSFMGWTPPAPNADILYAPGAGGGFAMDGANPVIVRADVTDYVISEIDGQASDGGAPVDYQRFAQGKVGPILLGVAGDEIFYAETYDATDIKAVSKTTKAVRVAYTAAPASGGFVWWQGPWLFDGQIYFVHEGSRGLLQRVSTAPGSVPALVVDVSPAELGAATTDAANVYYVVNATASAPSTLYAIAK